MQNTLILLLVPVNLNSFPKRQSLQHQYTPCWHAPTDVLFLLYTCVPTHRSTYVSHIVMLGYLDINGSYCRANQITE